MMPRAAETKGRETAVLHIVADLARRLDDEGIRYCHWKSNEHLGAGLSGETDLDLLVERPGIDRIGGILTAAGYKRFQAVPSSSYPAIEDYLGLDSETGRLSHVQIHHRLTVGEERLKGYRLPWEETVLDTCIVDPGSGVRFAEPDIEMLLLITRAALKLRLRDRIGSWTGLRGVSADLAREFAWLKERIDPPAVIALHRKLVGKAGSRHLEEILRYGPDAGRLSRLRRRAGSELSRYRTHGFVGARWRRWLHEVSWIRAGINRRYLHGPLPGTRTLPRGGILIAVVGADGSGKSSLVGEAMRWLSRKIDVHPVYFGSGDGPGSLVRWPLRIGLRLVKGITGGGGGGGNDGAGRPRSLRALRPIWAMALALEKRRKLRRGWMARNRGMVVLCDRYPQNQVPGFNDGPLLEGWKDSRSRTLRALANWEATPYRWAEEVPPDLVIKLDVRADVACSRKPEMLRSEVERRIAAVSGLSWDPRTRVVTIDSDAPAEAVLRSFKRAVWAGL